MSWLGLLLIGLGTTDLVFSARPGRHLPQMVGALVVLAGGLGCGLTSLRDLVAISIVGLSVLGWGQVVTRGFGRGPAALPLAWFAGLLILAIVASPWAGQPRGPVAGWLAHVPIAALADLDPARALVLLGVVLLQLSTGNVLVRLVLTATHTTNPLKGGRKGNDREIETQQLKGGRLIGPLERLFVLVLGLAGDVTAAGIVVAAKGLIRFPELQAARRSGEQGTGPGIHVVTEYFLLGSFVSWLIPLVCLVLLSR